MHAKKIKCRVLEIVWKSDEIFLVRFVPTRKFLYEPGQFLSVQIPRANGRGVAAKRCYSLSSSPEESKFFGHYELCVKKVEGGKGSSFLANLAPGDKFTAHVPYGKFFFEPSSERRSVCFIATGTGVGPFRSMVLSEKYLANPPEEAVLLHGVRHESEVLFKKDFEQAGVRAIPTVSQPTEDWRGFKGRVTDLIKKFPKDWKWHQTDFYICGNGDMAREVSDILQGGYGVPAEAIHQESFSPAESYRDAAGSSAPKKRRWFRLPALVKAA